MATIASQGRMDNYANQEIHPFFDLRQNIQPNSRDIDQHSERRKRRRTASPDHGVSSCGETVVRTIAHGWEAQLRFAAYGQRELSDKITDTGSGPIVDLESSKKDHDALAASKKDELVPESRLQSPEYVNTKQISNEPPKKMMAIRSDGKLTSPGSKGPAKNTVSRKKTAIKVFKSAVKQQIVILRYGAHDNSRTAVAEKIQEICSRNVSKLSLGLEYNKKSAISEEPIKPTHPFFLGPKAFKQLVANKTLEESDKEHETVTSSPRNADSSYKLSSSTSACTSFPGPAKVSHSPPGHPSPFSSGFVEPLWPPRDMMHIRSHDGPMLKPSKRAINHQAESMRERLKYSKVHILEHEDVLGSTTELVKLEKRFLKAYQPKTATFRRPKRRVMTGFELQSTVRKVMVSRLPDPLSLQNSDRNTDESDASRSRSTSTHRAILHLFNEIPTSLTAFDKFEWETQEWVHKYAPKCAEEVLQQGEDVVKLREWLKTLTRNSVEHGLNRACEPVRPFTASRITDVGLKRKKRKKSEDLDDFIVSSDEEVIQSSALINSGEFRDDSVLRNLKKSTIWMSDLSEKSKQGRRNANAVVISGPHGCGKTAAVYAVTQELDFEVFEINAGHRRSGKDILDKVGDMSRNHLVRQPRETDSLSDLEDPLALADPHTHKEACSSQVQVGSLFKPMAKVRHTPKNRTFNAENSGRERETAKQSQSQKQSVILLEEVDLLFDEDKQFWTTVLDLITRSKRPIIMTCSDESRLPLDEMNLFGIIRFETPPENLSIDYLLLIACNEGHLLSRPAVSLLLKAKHFDLRASIMQLNFFCQMTIGDTKGGLDWMLIRSSPQATKRGGDQLRVVSEGTYSEGIDDLISEYITPGYGMSIDQEMDMMSHIWECWAVDIEDTEASFLAQNQTQLSHTCREDCFRGLRALEQSFDTFSVADTFPSLRFRHENKILLDRTQPELSEKLRSNFVEDSTLLEADPLLDFTDTSNLLATSLRACARQIWSKAFSTATSANRSSTLHSMPVTTMNIQAQKQLTKSTLLAALDPIAHPKKLISTNQKGPFISSLDGPLSIIFEDLAPYVRSIISCDIRLKEQRDRLEQLLSKEGSHGKRLRTTRASRAALEGGNKASTRREKWFPDNPPFIPVLESGGDGWQEISQRVLQESKADSEHCSSRRSSSASVYNDEIT